VLAPPMIVYLDTNHLIDLLQHDAPCPFDDFRRSLEGGGHRLALTFTRVREIAAPLYYRDRGRIVPPASSAWSEIRPLLIRLDRLPLSFIHEVRINPLELSEAVAAFRESRPYQPVSPFVPRFDFTIQPDASPPASQHLINLGVAETVFLLLDSGSDVFSGQTTQSPHWPSFLARNRAIRNPPSLRENFVRVVRDELGFHRIETHGIDAGKLANWIYDSPERCPGKRLSYEVMHRLIADRAKPQASDLGDLSGVQCLPYVDIATMDRALVSRVNQAASRMRASLSVRIATNLSDAMQIL